MIEQDLWKDFINYQSSTQLFNQFINIFKSQIEEYYPNVIDNFNENNCCKRKRIKIGY